MEEKKTLEVKHEADMETKTRPIDPIEEARKVLAADEAIKERDCLNEINVILGKYGRRFKISNQLSLEKI